jgi:hypothetical protein
MTNPFKVRTGPGSEGSSTDLSQKLNEWLERSGPMGLFRTCGSCRFMPHAPAQPKCGKWQTIPPIDVLLAGCDAYSDECEPPLDADIPY